MQKSIVILLALLAMAAIPAAAQLPLPSVSGSVGDVLDMPNRALEPLRDTADTVANRASRMAEIRVERIANLVRHNRNLIELDSLGEPARKGEILLLEPDDATVEAAKNAGFTILERENLAELGLDIVRLASPSQLSLAQAEDRLKKLVPTATIAPDNLLFPAGAGPQKTNSNLVNPARMPDINIPVGIIDGAPGTAFPVTSLRGFALGAPTPSQHGSAVASLLATAGVRRIVVADVYGSDPAGGNALAISRAINWLIADGTPVISISLVGPNNPLLARAIAAAHQRGTLIVAAVGNDGPAAPPAYPASYTGVIAVTGVDGHNRPLIEAGRALHLDYAAPGADMFAVDTAGRWIKVRGTSYAVPLVAARAAAALSGNRNVIATLNGEAVDLGRKGPDTAYGRGLLCGSCRNRR